MRSTVVREKSNRSKKLTGIVVTVVATARLRGRLPGELVHQRRAPLAERSFDQALSCNLRRSTDRGNLALIKARGMGAGLARKEANHGYES